MSSPVDALIGPTANACLHPMSRVKWRRSGGRPNGLFARAGHSVTPKPHGVTGIPYSHA